MPLLPLQAGHEPAGADLGSRSVDVAQRSRSPARLREQNLVGDLSPPDTSLPCEYASESSPSKKLLCPKHGFASVVVVGTSASTKSLLCNSGHNSDYQLWNFVGRFRARVKFLDSRCGPAENDSMVRHGWTEGPAKHKEAPLTLCDSVFLFNFSGNFHFTSLDEQSRSARLYNFCEADLARD